MARVNYLNAQLEALLSLAARDRENIRWAADWQRLLPGEDPEHAGQEQIEHWIQVYGGLIDHNRELVNRIQNWLDSPDGAARGDGAERADLILLQAHLIRLQRRRLYWQQRRRLQRRTTAELELAPAGEAAGTTVPVREYATS